MTFVCLWNPRWRTAGAPLADLAAALLEHVPRVAVQGQGLLWADARGLPAPALAWKLREQVARRFPCTPEGATRAGVAAVPVAAEVAARGAEAPVSFVEPGHERAFLAPRGVELLGPDPVLRPLLAGAGIRTCGDLAALTREAVEVRLGASGAALWRLARGDDPRLLFGRIAREPAHASMDFVEYVVRDAARLLFAANALLGTVCGALQERGECARQLVLELRLAGGQVLVRPLRAARPTAERDAWVRRLRGVFDRLVLPDAVDTIGLRAVGMEPVGGSQGDLFDRGFASSGAVEEAVSRLCDLHGPLFVNARTVAHPLPDLRTTWEPRELDEVVHPPAPGGGAPTPPGLHLQLLAAPRPVAVRVRPRRDHLLPVRLLEGDAWQEIAAAGGPDRVSGGFVEDEVYAREYWRCVTAGGRLVWVFRDARENVWYLHGWWE